VVWVGPLYDSTKWIGRPWIKYCQENRKITAFGFPSKWLVLVLLVPICPGYGTSKMINALAVVPIGKREITLTCAQIMVALVSFKKVQW
jgi:hypothetical protein